MPGNPPKWITMAERRFPLRVRESQLARHSRRVRRLMRKLGLWAVWTVRPKRNTSKPHPGHKVYPYLLRGKTIDQANQVWAADITYIPMRQGFLYLVAIIDWATRRVLSWRLSNTLTAGFCVEAHFRGPAHATHGGHFISPPTR
jgi:putative transposase